MLLDLNSGAYYGLNHVGAKLLNILGSDGTVMDAIGQISERYQIDSLQVEKDVYELLEQLMEQKLISLKETKE